MEWEILNANNQRWGRETYPTKEAAEKELKQFWKGVSGVDLRKFAIRQVAVTPSNSTKATGEAQ